jgi:hypothetical protein
MIPLAPASTVDYPFLLIVDDACVCQSVYFKSLLNEIGTGARRHKKDQTTFLMDS